jgi:hypothetical protein
VGDVALVVDTFPERADPGPSRIPPEPQRELSIIVEQHHERPPTFTLPTPPRTTRIPLTTGTMGQPVVQTIHRDPALLYVRWLGDEERC